MRLCAILLFAAWTAVVTAELLPRALSHGEINDRLGDDPAYTAAVERFLATLSARLAERLR